MKPVKKRMEGILDKAYSAVACANTYVFTYVRGRTEAAVFGPAHFYLLLPVVWQIKKPK